MRINICDLISKLGLKEIEFNSEVIKLHNEKFIINMKNVNDELEYLKSTCRKAEVLFRFIVWDKTPTYKINPRVDLEWNPKGENCLIVLIYQDRVSIYYPNPLLDSCF